MVPAPFTYDDNDSYRNNYTYSGSYDESVTDDYDECDNISNISPALDFSDIIERWWVAPLVTPSGTIITDMLVRYVFSEDNTFFVSYGNITQRGTFDIDENVFTLTIKEMYRSVTGNQFPSFSPIIIQGELQTMHSSFAIVGDNFEMLFSPEYVRWWTTPIGWVGSICPETFYPRVTSIVVAMNFDYTFRLSVSRAIWYQHSPDRGWYIHESRVDYTGRYVKALGVFTFFDNENNVIAIARLNESPLWPGLDTLTIWYLRTDLTITLNPTNTRILI